MRHGKPSGIIFVGLPMRFMRASSASVREQLWNFAREPRAFELQPPLHAHVTLITTSYEARFR